MAVEQFRSHIALAVQVADMGGRKSEERYLWVQIQQALYTFAPLGGSAAVKFVQNDVIRMDIRCSPYFFC
jgi:hypothetical protein